MTENTIVVSQCEALPSVKSEKTSSYLQAPTEPACAARGHFSLHGAFLWAQPPTAVKHSRFSEHIIKHFGFSYFVAK